MMQEFEINRSVAALFDIRRQHLRELRWQLRKELRTGHIPALKRVVLDIDIGLMEHLADELPQRMVVICLQQWNDPRQHHIVIASLVQTRRINLLEPRKWYCRRLAVPSSRRCQEELVRRIPSNNGAQFLPVSRIREMILLLLL